MELLTEQIWSSIRKRVESDSRYDLLNPWMGRLKIKASSEDNLVLSLPDESLRPFLTRQHLHLLSQVAGSTLEQEPRITLHDHLDVEILEYVPSKLPSLQAQKKTTVARPLTINKHQRFDNFFIGASNRLACAAAKAVSQKPGGSFNPLFLSADVGMGKTHLLHAICQSIQENHDGKSIVYVSGKEFIDAIAQDHESSEQLLQSCCHADVLIMDDLHLLESDPAAQEELFHLFNAFYDSQRQMIFSSGKSIKNLESMKESLISRLKWGMMVELDPPTQTMRLEIIRSMLEEKGFELSDELQSYLSEQVLGNMRELQGAMVKLIGYAQLLGEEINLTAIKQVLGDFLPQIGKKNFTIEDIQNLTCEAFGISLTDMLSKKRARSLVLPRHVAMHLVRSLTNASLEEVGHRFGGRDHSTVKHGCEKVQKMMQSDTNLQYKVNRIKKKLLASC